MTQEATIFEKQIDVNVVVGVVDVTLNLSAQEVIVMPGAGLPGVVASTWERKISSFYPANGGSYEVDSRVAAVDVYLPENPVDGYVFGLRDGYAFFGTNPCNLVPFPGSGHKIIQTSVVEETMTLNYPHVGTGFLVRYRALDKTWSW